MISRRGLLTAAAAPYISRAAAKKTNIVFILTDDHGAWALHSYGCSDIHTPNLDRLASEGARFTRAYACTPVCSASRATYLTGRLPSHHGVPDYLLPDDSAGPTSRDFLQGQPTFTEALAGAGYAVGLSGKWHMGHDDKAHAGFSYWATVPGGASRFKDVTFVKNGTQVPTKGFKEDRLGDNAIEFIDQNKERPFCLYLAFFAPHKPYDYQPDEHRHWYADSKFPCFPDTPIHPRHVRKMNGQPFPTLLDFNNREAKLSYSALVTGMDHNVDCVVKRLEELGLRENTVIVFSADQGHCCGHHGIWGKGNSTWPFNMYDTSLHVPLIWNHPGRIKPGQTPDPMVSSYDFFPTLLDYAGVDAPKDPKRVGRSYAGFLRGQPPRWRNELYFEYEYVRGIRTENLKYIERTAGWPGEMYDLETDPGELKNVIDDAPHSKEKKALQTRLHSFFARNGAPPIEQWRGTTKQSLAVYSR